MMTNHATYVAIVSIISGGRNDACAKDGKASAATRTLTQGALVCENGINFRPPWAIRGELFFARTGRSLSDDMQPSEFGRMGICVESES